MVDPEGINARIEFSSSDTECPGQKTWSHHDCAISFPAGTALFLLLSVFTLIFRCSISQARIWADFQTPAGFD